MIFGEILQRLPTPIKSIISQIPLIPPPLWAPFRARFWLRFWLILGPLRGPILGVNTRKQRILKLFDPRKGLGFGLPFDPLSVPFLAPLGDPFGCRNLREIYRIHWESGSKSKDSYDSYKDSAQRVEDCSVGIAN